MQLISLPVSPFAARVRLAIYAKALPVEIVPPPAGWPTIGNSGTSVRPGACRS